MKKYILILSLCLFFSASLAEASKTYKIGPPSSVSFYVEHIIGFSSGQFLEFDGTVVLSDDEKTVESVEVIIQASSLSERSEEREEGLKNENFLNVAKYPEIIIKSTKITKDKIITEVTSVGMTKKVEFKYFDYGVMLMEGVPTAMVGMQGIIDRTIFGMDYNVKSEQTGKEMLGTDFQVTLHLDAMLGK